MVIGIGGCAVKSEILTQQNAVLFIETFKDRGRMYNMAKMVLENSPPGTHVDLDYDDKTIAIFARLK